MGRKWGFAAGGTNPAPAVRVLRTVIQVVLAALVAVPAAVALLGLSAEVTGKITGIAGAAVVIISAIQNGIEARVGKTALATDTPQEG